MPQDFKPSFPSRLFRPRVDANGNISSGLTFSGTGGGGSFGAYRPTSGPGSERWRLEEEIYQRNRRRQAMQQAEADRREERFRQEQDRRAFMEQNGIVPGFTGPLRNRDAPARAAGVTRPTMQPKQQAPQGLNFSTPMQPRQLGSGGLFSFTLPGGSARSLFGRR